MADLTLTFWRPGADTARVRLTPRAHEPLPLLKEHRFVPPAPTAVQCPACEAGIPHKQPTHGIRKLAAGDAWRFPGIEGWPANHPAWWCEWQADNLPDAATHATLLGHPDGLELRLRDELLDVDLGRYVLRRRYSPATARSAMVRHIALLVSGRVPPTLQRVALPGA